MNMDISAQHDAYLEFIDEMIDQFKEELKLRDCNIIPPDDYHIESLYNKGNKSISQLVDDYIASMRIE